MTDEGTVFQKLRARGEEVFNQVSNDLMGNPRFVKAMQHALRGKERLDGAVARVLKTMNVPTRTEFKKAVRRIEVLEAELEALKSRVGKAPGRRVQRKA